MKKEFIEILIEKKSFPCKLKKKDGELLKKFFKKDINFGINSINTKKINDLEFRYIYEEEGIKYILLEEYIFKEEETFLSLENSIGVEYYFNKI